MNARNRPLLVIAITAALMAPLAMAQNVSDAATPTTPQSQPAPATQAERTSEALLNTNAPPSVQQLNETEPPQPPEVEEAAMNPPKPPPANQGANTTDQWPAAKRSVWAQLDVDGDGRVSGSEGRVDADFQANFEMMDADRDGYVSDAEYRARVDAAEAEREQRASRDQEGRDD